jgi:hypothetical protein
MPAIGLRVSCSPRRAASDGFKDTVLFVKSDLPFSHLSHHPPVCGAGLAIVPRRSRPPQARAARRSFERRYLWRALLTRRGAARHPAPHHFLTLKPPPGTNALHRPVKVLIFALLQFGGEGRRWPRAGGLLAGVPSSVKVCASLASVLERFVALALATACAWAGLMSATAKPAALRLVAKRIH